MVAVGKTAWGGVRFFGLKKPPEWIHFFKIECMRFGLFQQFFNNFSTNLLKNCWKQKLSQQIFEPSPYTKVVELNKFPTIFFRSQWAVWHINSSDHLAIINIRSYQIADFKMTRMRSYNIRPPIKSLSSRRRHLGLKGRDRMVLLQLQVIIHILFREYKARKLLEYAFSAIERIRNLIIKCCVFYDYILESPKELYKLLPPIISKSRPIDSFADEDIPANFKFRDKHQLRTLFRCFQLPDHIISASGHIFKSEELLLVTLFRLHVPGIATDFCNI